MVGQVGALGRDKFVLKIGELLYQLADDLGRAVRPAIVRPVGADLVEQAGAQFGQIGGAVVRQIRCRALPCQRLLDRCEVDRVFFASLN